MKAFGLLALLSMSALLLAFQAPGDIFLDFGPNDARYVSGFREDFEIDEPTLIHWSKDRARIRLPFYLRSPYEVTLRFKRHIEKPAEIRLFLDGQAVETFTVPRQDFAVRRFQNPSPRRRPSSSSGWCRARRTRARSGSPSIGCRSVHRMAFSR